MNPDLKCSTTINIMQSICSSTNIAVLVILVPYGLSEYVIPTVTLLSCMYETASVRIDNATAGGLLYARTDTAYNILPTTDGTMFYECTFESCNIQWMSDDKVQWSVCNSNFGNIMPINIDFGIMEMDNLTLVISRPDNVLMRFFSNGTEAATGSNVKLGTQIDMHLEVLKNDNGYFDILPKACWASAINLLVDQCPVDVDLFGGFTQLAPGNITNTFYMFRPTTTAGGPYEVTFTCLLEVCMYNCIQPTCDESNSMITNSTRRKRAASKQEHVSNPSMILGGMLRAIAEGEDIVEIEPPPTTRYCVQVDILVILFTTFILALLLACLMTTFNFYRYQLCQKEINSCKAFKDGHSASTDDKDCGTDEHMKTTIEEKENNTYNIVSVTGVKENKSGKQGDCEGEDRGNSVNGLDHSQVKRNGDPIAIRRKSISMLKEMLTVSRK